MSYVFGGLKSVVAPVAPSEESVPTPRIAIEEPLQEQAKEYWSDRARRGKTPLLPGGLPFDTPVRPRQQSQLPKAKTSTPVERLIQDLHPRMQNLPEPRSRMQELPEPHPPMQQLPKPPRSSLSGKPSRRISVINPDSQYSSALHALFDGPAASSSLSRSVTTPKPLVAKAPHSTAPRLDPAARLTLFGSTGRESPKVSDLVKSFQTSIDKGDTSMSSDNSKDDLRRIASRNSMRSLGGRPSFGGGSAGGGP